MPQRGFLIFLTTCWDLCTNSTFTTWYLWSNQHEQLTILSTNIYSVTKFDENTREVKKAQREVIQVTYSPKKNMVLLKTKNLQDVHEAIFVNFQYCCFNVIKHYTMYQSAKSWMIYVHIPVSNSWVAQFGTIQRFLFSMAGRFDEKWKVASNKIIAP